MNKAILMGRLTKDPELRYTQNNNTAVCTFTLAVDRDYTPEGQEKQADFLPIIIWQKSGEAAARLLEKGRKIGVVGRIQTRTWDDTEGNKHYATEIVVENWYFADDKKKEQTTSTTQQQPQQQQQYNPPPQQQQQQQQQQSAPANSNPPWMS
jgi:single-strand DNA-binding protein